MAQLCDKYERLVAQKAWRCWRRLPPQTRTWISVEDLMQDGMLLLHHAVKKRYQPSKSSLTTFVWLVLENFYKTYASYHFMKKRFDGRTCQLDEELGLELPSNFADECHSVELLLKLYASASHPLRMYLEQWFFRIGQRNKRVRIKSPKFAVAKTEFVALAEELGFTADECRGLLYSETWRKRLPTDWRQQSSKIGVCGRQKLSKSLPAVSVERDTPLTTSAALSTSRQQVSALTVTKMARRRNTAPGVLASPPSNRMGRRSTDMTHSAAYLAG